MLCGAATGNVSLAGPTVRRRNERTYRSVESSQRARSCLRTKSGPTLLRVYSSHSRGEREKNGGSRTRFHIDVSPLHPEHVRAERKHASYQADGGTPPDDGRANQVILALHVRPGAHAQADPQQRPIRWQGREDVILVWVWYEGVVRGHHRDIQVPKVAQERRAVEFGVTRGHCVAQMGGQYTPNPCKNGQKTVTYSGRSSGSRRSNACKGLPGCSSCRSSLRSA